MYVDTVNTKHIYTFLPITFLIFNRFSISKKFWKAETRCFSTIPSILYMSTLSILGISISNAFLPITFLRSHPNSFLCVCRQCRQTTAYTIHNSIALILCINHLDMPFNVHTTDKVTMITVSGFLTI